jgi:hypothetical protein
MPGFKLFAIFQLPHLSFHLFRCDFCFLWRHLLLVQLSPASPSSFLPSSSFMKYTSHSCIVISSFTDSFFSLSRFMYFHTSLSVLIYFISFSSLSPLCFFFSLHLSLSLYLLFASRNLLLSILFLLHALNAFTASFFRCSYSLSHHPFLLSALLTPLLSPPFSSSLSRSVPSALPASSPPPSPQMLLFLGSSGTLPLFVHPTLLLSPSSAPPLLPFPLFNQVALNYQFSTILC